MRAGEANSLLWIDTDTERRTITLSQPEKNSNPRIFKVSAKLMGMLNRLPKTSKKVFGTTMEGRKTTFYHSRKLAARKLQNPRLLQISFHTFRHWKATMEYHKTKDPYHVKAMLGHKSILSTDIYIHIEHAIFRDLNDDFHVKVAKTLEEDKQLIEVGFEYITERDGVKIYRKRK